MKSRLELFLQLLIIAACLVILSSTWNTQPLSAQIQCNGQPPIKTNDDPNPWFQLRANMWLPGVSPTNKRQVTVIIFDTTPENAAQIEEGIRDWNNSATAQMYTSTQQHFQPVLWVNHLQILCGLPEEAERKFSRKWIQPQIK